MLHFVWGFMSFSLNLCDKHVVLETSYLQEARSIVGNIQVTFRCKENFIYEKKIIWVHT